MRIPEETKQKLKAFFGIVAAITLFYYVLKKIFGGDKNGKL